ncbi:glycerophosphodiester phosphodiesterase family protein [Eubacteriales bacterium OttesenSCG-928-A19]|nr:glycerophosphodiester phosphodiesterase family protein [Eubacteriales bacterium OttesenSCG-928-A19]
MNWPERPGTMLVAGHRGMRYTLPENTMTAFRAAIALGVDMIETDVRMTVDGQIVLMHDEAVDRTTGESGLVREMSLERFLSLNAACDYEDIAPEPPATLDGLMALCDEHPELLINFELKDYPTPGLEAFALESMERTLEAVEAHGMRERCVINSFSGRLLEAVAERYPGRYRLHGFYPFEAMGEMKRDPRDILYCVCAWPFRVLPDGRTRPLNYNVPPRECFEVARKAGLEVWIGPSVRSRAELEACVERGARMVTTDYPEDALHILREG